MPGLAPAGEVLSCCAARKYPKKRAPPPRPATSPDGSALAPTLEQRGRKPRSTGAPLGGSEGVIAVVMHSE